MLRLAPLLLIPAAAVAAEQVELNGHQFTVADGWTVELAAEPGLSDRPVSACFDDAGRLFVTESSGSNEPVEVQWEKKPHRLLMLEDADGDGAFDRRTVFAEGLMLPQGCLCRDGWVYVAAAPTIERFRDTTGDGVADDREVWFDGKVLSFCANDLHGPYLGPDGVLYWTKGAFEEQRHPRPGGPDFVTRAAHVFRRSPVDDTVEPVLTGGMDNPVEVAWTAAGDGFCCATFVQHPGNGRRDGIVPLVRGGLFGKRHGVLDGFPHVGELLDPTTHLGAAAPAGLCRPAVGADPDEPELFCAQFNTRRVSSHRPVADGAGWRTDDAVLLESDRFEFHPTDVLEDADGSLLVVDTGGWYKLCCPTSQVEQPDVLGAIYRLRPTTPKLPTAVRDDPRGTRLAWGEATTAELVARLTDPRPAVADRAVETLAKRGDAAVPALKKVLETGDPAARAAAVWGLTRVPGEQARAAVRAVVRDADPPVRRAALRSAALWRDAAAADAAIPLLTAADPLDRRLAAELVADADRRDAVPALLTSAADAGGDPVLHAALTSALIELGDAVAVRRGLAGPAADDPDALRAAILALAALPGGELDPHALAPRLFAEDAELRRTVERLFDRREDYAGPLAAFLRRRLNRGVDDRTLDLLARYADRPLIAPLLTDAAAKDPAGVWRRVADAGVGEVPEAWDASLAAALSDLAARPHALRLLADAGLPDRRAVADAVRAVGDDAAAPTSDRFAAWALLPSVRVDAERLAELRTVLLDPAAAGRDDAPRVVAAASFGDEARGELPGLLAEVGPLTLPKVLPAVRGGDGAFAAAALAAVAGNPAFAALPADELRAAFADYGPDVRAGVDAALDRREADRAAARAGLAATFDALPPGDASRGAAVFRSEKAACMTCHRIGQQGGDFGPSLFDIGKIRTKRDLHEAVVLPSAAFVRSYEPWVVLTEDGQTFSGLLKDETGDAVTLAVTPTERVTVERAAILEMAPGPVSVMPAGLDRQISDRQMADLLAFLAANRGWE